MKTENKTDFNMTIDQLEKEVKDDLENRNIVEELCEMNFYQTLKQITSYMKYGLEERQTEKLSYKKLYEHMITEFENNIDEIEKLGLVGE